MRTEARRLSTCVGALWLLPLAPVLDALAQPPSPRIEIVDPGPLRVGQAASVEVTLQAPHGQRPLLLTPSTEGKAISVVRGRLLRSDARDPDARVLHFTVPVLAHSAGTAILRVEVVTYICDRACRAVQSSQTRVLRAVAP